MRTILFALCGLLLSLPGHSQDAEDLDMEFIHTISVDKQLAQGQVQTCCDGEQGVQCGVPEPTFEL